MKSLREQLNAALTEAKSINESSEGRDFTDQEQDRIAELKNITAALRVQIGKADEAKAASSALMKSAVEEAGRRSGVDLTHLHDAPGSAPYETKGRQVVAPGLHEQSKSFRTAVNKAMAEAAPLVGGVGRKSLVPTGSVSIDYGQIPIAMPGQTDWLANYVQQNQIEAPSGMYLREANRQTAATTVQMNTEKPVLAMSLSPVTWRCATVAVLSQPMPLQNLSDYGTLSDYITERLAFDSMRAIDKMILNGGTDEEGNAFNGVLTDASVASIAFDTSLVATLRDAMEDLQLADVTPAMIALNPADWKALETESDNAGRPLLNFQPNMLTQRSLYGVPVVVNNSVPAGTALVGDLHQAVALLTRQQGGLVSWRQLGTPGSADAEINLMGDALFSKNLGQFRYEGRYALTIPQPTALRKVKLAKTA